MAVNNNSCGSGSEAGSWSVSPLTLGEEKSGETNGTKKTTSVQHSDPEHPSADPELFTPEEVDNDSEDKHMAEYRFFCPHPGLFKCTLTNIVFEMEGKGNVHYNVLYWYQKISDELGPMEPAGPLYNINCPESSVRRLHFPHCETHKDKVKLTVAHVIDHKMEFIKPLTVTDTHVTIDVQRLSWFGLTLPLNIFSIIELLWTRFSINKLLLNRFSIRAHVLLFYKIEYGVIKLHVYLLPANVPIAEVQRKHEDYTNFITTSDCDLISDNDYSLLCNSAGHDYETYPECATLYRVYGPNYHPTFEVHLPLHTEITEVMVLIVDKKGKVQWKSPDLILSGAVFVDRHREKLIQRFHSVMEVADHLRGKKMISQKMYSRIQAKPTPRYKMRELYKCLDSTGKKAKKEFYDLLVKDHLFTPDLIRLSEHGME